MNKVFVSGVVASAPCLKQKAGQSAHTEFLLRVTHRKSSGEYVHETYPVNAWGKAAVWSSSRLKANSRITLSGYLTQRIREGRIMTEITAEEFITLFSQEAETL